MHDAQQRMGRDSDFNRCLNQVLQQSVRERIAIANTSFAEVSIGFCRSRVDRVLVPILSPFKKFVWIARKTRETFREPELVATYKCVDPITGEVVEAKLGIEQTKNFKIARCERERAIVGIVAGVVELRFVCSLFHEDGHRSYARLLE